MTKKGDPVVHEHFDDCCAEDFADEEFVEEMLPEMFTMMSKSQEAALALTKLVIKYGKEETLAEQEIYAIYHRSFDEIMKAFDKGLN